jgi:hypothetical protein
MAVHRSYSRRSPRPPSSSPPAPARNRPPAGGDDAEASYGEISVQYSWIKNEEFAGPDTGVAKLLSGTVEVALSDAASVGAAIAEQEAPLKIIGATLQPRGPRDRQRHRPGHRPAPLPAAVHPRAGVAARPGGCRLTRHRSAAVSDVRRRRSGP